MSTLYKSGQGGYVKFHSFRALVLTLNPNPSLVLRWSDKPWILGTVTPGENKIMTYESSTPFINASLAEHCLSVEFNRPDALNALRPEMLSEAARLVRQASDDAEVKVIVLRGAGRAFSAGVDLKVCRASSPRVASSETSLTSPQPSSPPRFVIRACP